MFAGWQTLSNELNHLKTLNYHSQTSNQFFGPRCRKNDELLHIRLRCQRTRLGTPRYIWLYLKTRLRDGDSYGLQRFQSRKCTQKLQTYSNK